MKKYFNGLVMIIVAVLLIIDIIQIDRAAAILIFFGITNLLSRFIDRLNKDMEY